MIITRTPFRVSLFGGGSDYPAWFEQHGGEVLGFSINKYCYITLRELPAFFEHKHRIVYSKFEHVQEVDEIQHPVVRAVLSEMTLEHGLEIHHDGDLPARTGLGSSSSFTAGLLKALAGLERRYVDKRTLALESIRIEQKVLREAVGNQDQIWASYGGLNRIFFHQGRDFEVDPIIISKERKQQLVGSFMLFFTGISRFASEVAQKKIENLGKKEAEITRMVDMVSTAHEILVNPNEDLLQIGALLHESWMLKRGLSDVVTSSHIDGIYQSAREAGALGGKLLGAGGGGFMLFYVEPENQQSVRERLSGLIEVDIDIDYDGCKIIFCEN
ncbi:kinase [Terasakiella pusilla]|uniref:GHMP family kinase ATP-binding protein n=1 Tax=Terasakiella pusilla TaxID=64973 RepID=UPI003AA87A34